MTTRVNIQSNPQNRFSFLEKGTEESLINDIKCLLYNINRGSNLTTQKEHILALNYHLKMLFNTYEQEVLMWEHKSLLSEAKWFILRTNVTIQDFKIKIQLKFNNHLHNID